MKEAWGYPMPAVKSLGYLMMLVLAFLAIDAKEAVSQGPVWEVGRAVLVGSANTPSELKLSLRNTGRTGSAEVKILYRWVLTPEEAGKIESERGRAPGSLSGYAVAGSYSGEVALKQTAIIEAPLGTVPAGAQGADVVVVTADRATDRRFVRIQAGP